MAKTGPVKIDVTDVMQHLESARPVRWCVDYNRQARFECDALGHQVVEGWVLLSVYPKEAENE